MNTDFSLRLLADDDLPALQRLYEQRLDRFAELLGRPPLPEQAALDFVAALASPARFQFAVLFGGGLIGMVDCQLSGDVEGKAHIGWVLLAREFDTPATAGLAVRIIIRWLEEQYSVREVEAGVLAHEPEQIAFWQGEGFALTGEQYRRDLPEYAPRFLVLRRLTPAPGPESPGLCTET